MREIDKNDVDISKLFHWGTSFTFSYGDEDYTVYVRLLGDADLNRAKTFAIRKSAELRKKLRTYGTDENLAFIPEEDIVTKEEIINGVLISLSRTLTLEAYREVKINLPKEPDSDADLEEKEKYQEEVDSYPIKKDEAIQKYVMKRIEKLRKDMEKETKETLYNRFVGETINRLCEDEMVNKFREMCTYLGTYIDPDHKVRVFDTFEEFANLPTIIKEQFTEVYFAQDMDTENLKKLHVVTQ